MTGLLGDALALATIAHANSNPYGDQPYITHPIAVAELVTSVGADPQVVAAALLHDTVEDVDWMTLGLLHRYGIPRRTIQVVDAVSRRQGEVYMDFVRRAALDADGLLVKLADNTHNLSTLRGDDPRVRRYVRARAILVEASDGNDPWADVVAHQLGGRS